MKSVWIKLNYEDLITIYYALKHEGEDSDELMNFISHIIKTEFNHKFIG